MKILSYSDSDRTFILIDGRNIDCSRYSRPEIARTLCRYYGAESLFILKASKTSDFELSGPVAPDDAGCRCAVAFADLLGLKGFYASDYSFETVSGVRNAVISKRLGEAKTISVEGSEGIVLCQGECCGD